MNHQGKSRRERIEYARSRSILDVAHDLGMELFRSGKDYRWKEHDSLVINPDKNLWNWFSRDDEGGDVIALVESMKKVDFNQAIDFLNDGQFKDFQQTEARQEAFHYYLESYEKPLVEGWQFLKEQRGLSDETIDFFLKQGVLSQANAKLDAFWDEPAKRLGGQSVPEPVIVFKSLSSSKELVGASLQGIEENWDKWSKHGYAKVIMKNSDSMTGFHVDIGQPKRLVFAESPIDLMSYYQLKRGELADVRLVSMNGLKESTISYHLAQLEAELSGTQLRWTKKELEKTLDVALVRGYFADGKNQDKITLAVDNDEAGRRFIDSLQKKGVSVRVDLPPILEEGQVKSDWNDILQKQSVKQNELFQDLDYQNEVSSLIDSITQEDSSYYLWQDEELLNLGADSTILEEFHGLLEDQSYHIDSIPLYVEESVNDGATGYLSIDGSVLDEDGIRDYLNDQGFSGQESVEFLTKLKDELPEIWNKVFKHYDQIAEKIIEKYKLGEQQDLPISQMKTYDEVKQENEQLVKRIEERLKAGELTISFDTDVYLYDVFANLGNSHPLKYVNDKRFEVLAPLRPILESINDETVDLYKNKGTLEQDSLYQALKPYKRTLGVDISTRFIGELAIAAYSTNKQVDSLKAEQFGHYYGPQTLDNLSRSIERMLEYPLIELGTKDFNYGFVTIPNAFYHYLEEQEGDVVLSRSDLDLLMARIEEHPLRVVESIQEEVLAASKTQEKAPEQSPGQNIEELVQAIVSIDENSFYLGHDSELYDRGATSDEIEVFHNLVPTIENSGDSFRLTIEESDQLGVSGFLALNGVSIDETRIYDHLENLGLNPEQQLAFLEDLKKTVSSTWIRTVATYDQVFDEVVAMYNLENTAKEATEVVNQKEKSPEKAQEILNDRASVGEGSLQLEAEGSTKPVAETATFEQTVTSHPTSPYPYLYFNTNFEPVQRRKSKYHPINAEDLKRMNQYSPSIQRTAQWYLDELSGSHIHYFYSDKGEMNILDVSFKQENFLHLIGIRPIDSAKQASDFVVDFAQGYGSYNQILVSNNLKDKLQVLPMLEDILDPTSFVLDNLEEVRTAKRLNLSEAIKSKDEDFLLLFKDIGDELVPASLMKIKGEIKADLDNTDEKIIFGVFRNRDGVIEQLSINEEYVKDDGQEMLSILQNKQYEESIDVETVQEVEESVDRSIEEMLGTNAANSLFSSIPQIQENLSVERNLLAIVQDDGRVLYTNQEDFGQEHQVELVVHSGIELDQLSEAQAPWTLALIKGDEKLGYLAYGSDWGNDFQIENELKNIAGQINFGKVLEGLYKQEEVEAFLASNIENTDDQEILSILQNKQYEESMDVDKNQEQTLSLSAEEFTLVLDAAYNVGEPRKQGNQPPEEFHVAWERYYELSDAHEGNFTAVVEAANQLELLDKKSSFYQEWSQDRIYAENYHVFIQWFERWSDGAQLPFTEAERVDYQRFAEVLYEKNKIFYERNKQSVDIVNETGNQEAYIPYTKVKFDVYAPGGKLIKEGVRYNIGDETEPISRLLGMGYRRLEGYEALAKMDEEILNQLENQVVAAESESQAEEESYALRRARGKLERLKNERDEAIDSAVDHQKQTNGQPMNDKRGGQPFFKKQSQKEDKVFALLDEIEKQEERITLLEDKERWKKQGLNRRGTGLDISVENIPLIEAEIAKAEKGEGSYSRQTIKRYKTELVKLKAMQEKMDNVTIHPKVQELIDAGKLSQWKKQPTIYFVKGMRKVAVELTDDGQLQLPSSGKFHPKTSEDKDAVQELLFSVSQEKEVQQSDSVFVEEGQNPLQTEKIDYSQISAQELSEVAFQKIREFSQDPEALKEYLDFMSRFPQLSPRNAALIQAQWPGANAVATYKQWQGIGESLGITPEDVIETTATYKNKKTGEVNEVVRQNLSVKVGEKAQITLFRPIMVDMIPVLDEQGRQMKNDKGNPQYKKLSQATPQEKALVKEGKLPVRQFQQRDSQTGYPRYTTYKVFELSQTTLKPEAYPKAMPNRHYDFNLDQVRTKEVLSGLCDYSKKIGVPILEDDAQVLGNAKGAFDRDSQQILLNKGNTPGEMIATSIHELAHATLHNPKFTDLYRDSIGKVQKELEAEMTSYLVSSHFGLDTSEKAISYMAIWTKNLASLTDQELTQSMKRIHQTTARIVQCVEQHTKPYSLEKQIEKQRSPFQEKKKGLNP